MKEPTHALQRIESEKWKPLLPLLCEVSVPVEREPVTCMDQLLSVIMGHILTGLLFGFRTSFAVVGAALICNRAEILVLLISQAKL